jgi:hypothetical protein
VKWLTRFDNLFVEDVRGLHPVRCAYCLDALCSITRFGRTDYVMITHRAACLTCHARRLLPPLFP